MNIHDYLRFPMALVMSYGTPGLYPGVIPGFTPGRQQGVLGPN